MWSPLYTKVRIFQMRFKRFFVCDIRELSAGDYKSVLSIDCGDDCNGREICRMNE